MTPSVKVPHNQSSRIANRSWHGCTDPNGCIHFGSGGGWTLGTLLARNVPRLLLVHPSEDHGGFDGLRLVNATVIGGAGTDRNEAFALHGNGRRYPGTIRNIHLQSVGVFEWDDEPFVATQCSLENIVLEGWISEAKGPVKIAVEPWHRVNGFCIKGGIWANPKLEIVIRRAKYSAEQLTQIEAPNGWSYRLRLEHGPLERHNYVIGTYDNLDDLRAAIERESENW